MKAGLELYLKYSRTSNALIKNIISLFNFSWLSFSKGKFLHRFFRKARANKIREA
jgi:hypothetical protein